MKSRFGFIFIKKAAKNNLKQNGENNTKIISMMGGFGQNESGGAKQVIGHLKM